MSEDVEALFRREAGRVLATLIRLVGDFELAEEALQEAFAAALEQWPAAGAPANPPAWLINVGRHKAIDRLRRRALFARKRQDLETQAIIEGEIAPSDVDDDAFGDDMLRLIFTCCHPALGAEAQVALILRAVAGLPTQAVARAFLVSDETMAQRLVRAKRKIRVAKIPYETPAADMLPGRVEGVLTAIYLVFTEGYAMTSGEDLIREDLCAEAIRLGRLLSRLLPDRPAVEGLLALLLLHDARRPARATRDGDIVLLEDQDRGLWDQTRIAEGLTLMEKALRAGGRPSPYVVQAAIAALHVQGDGLAPDRRSLRGAPANPALAGGRTQSRGRRFDGRRASAGARSSRRAGRTWRARSLPPAACGARRRPGAAGPPSRSPRGLPRRPRGGEPRTGAATSG